MSARSSLMDFQVPKITHEDVRENRGVFQIEPLDRGFGYTFGNSLPRVLLSSLEGAGVTSVKLEGDAHALTTLPGVREDVTDIILNLKQLVCILHGDSPEIEVRLTAKGEGTITAGDIEAAAARRPGAGRRRGAKAQPRRPTPGPPPTSRSSTRPSRSRTSRRRAASRS